MPIVDCFEHPVITEVVSDPGIQILMPGRSVELMVFKLFAGIMTVSILLVYLCSRKNPLIKAIEDEDIYRIRRIARRKPKWINEIIDLNPGTTTPLICAIYVDMRTGNSFEPIELLIDYGADVNLTDKAGRSPLLIAAGGGNVHLVQLLLKNGANPSYIVPRQNYNPDSEKTPLDAARNARHDKIVEILLDHQRTNK